MAERSPGDRGCATSLGRVTRIADQLQNAKARVVYTGDGERIEKMDTLGIEPNTSRMLSERDNQLHHVPVEPGVWPYYRPYTTSGYDLQNSDCFANSTIIFYQ